MPKAQPAAPETSPAAYDPDTLYDVRLNEIVTARRMILKPMNRHQIRGDLLNAIVAEKGRGVIDVATIVE